MGVVIMNGAPYSLKVEPCKTKHCLSPGSDPELT